MKKALSILVIAVIFFIADRSYAQLDPIWKLGAGIGGIKGINEAFDQSLNTQFHFYGLWFNGIARHWSAEAGISFGKISSPHQGGYSEYSTSITPIDLRIRFAPLESNIWQPYLYGGIGLVHYSVSTPLPSNVASDAKLSGSALFLLFGAGMAYSIDKEWAIEGEAGICPSFSDNLNPVHDNRNDAFWRFSIGISYSLGMKDQSESSDDFFGAWGSVRILSHIVFDSAGSRLKKESEEELNQILSAMKDQEDIQVEFRSYTDNSGDFNTNMALTHDRAESVKVWLVSRGISAKRISTQGYGPHNPLVQNNSPENKARNCRLEMVRMK